MHSRVVVAAFGLIAAAAACNGEPRGSSVQRAQPGAPESTKAASAAAATPVSGGPAAATKPVLVAGAVPVAAFVAEELLGAQGARTVVYVGARWCEPCQRFHRALESGALDAELSGVRFIEYDYDTAEDALIADGYQSRLIPLFALPEPDGRASAHAISGSIKGEGAVANILPRLKALLGLFGPGR